MDRSRIRLLAAAIAAAVVLTGVATHFLLPPYLSGRIESRLEERGGRAEVKLRAVPALRLLAGHGDRIEIDGSGLRYDLDEHQNAFERLDRFDEVRIDLREVTAGPFETGRFRLERRDGGRYRIDVEASASMRDVLAFAGERFGPLGGLFGTVAGEAVPLSGLPVPIRLDGELESRDGRVAIVAGEGRVAGLPAGPLAELVTNAILSRL